MSRLVADIAICTGFYTRLWVPEALVVGGDFARAQWAAPVAGALVGAFGAAGYAASHAAGLPPTVAAALVLATTMLVTGCLHEDGLADMADGLGGGRTRERKLEIMRDSRIGTFGGCALLMSILLRWAAIVALAEPPLVAAALIGAHAAARSVIPAFMRWTPLARAEGLSAAAGVPTVAASTVAIVLGMLSLLLLRPTVFLSAAVLLLAWVTILRRLALRQIGGQTGDVLGGLEQGAEIIVLLVAVAAVG